MQKVWFILFLFIKSTVFVKNCLLISADIIMFMEWVRVLQNSLLMMWCHSIVILPVKSLNIMFLLSVTTKYNMWTKALFFFLGYDLLVICAGRWYWSLCYNTIQNPRAHKQRGSRLVQFTPLPYIYSHDFLFFFGWGFWHGVLSKALIDIQNCFSCAFCFMFIIYLVSIQYDCAQHNCKWIYLCWKRRVEDCIVALVQCELRL